MMPENVSNYVCNSIVRTQMHDPVIPCVGNKVSLLRSFVSVRFPTRLIQNWKQNHKNYSDITM